MDAEKAEDSKECRMDDVDKTLSRQSLGLIGVVLRRRRQGWIQLEVGEAKSDAVVAMHLEESDGLAEYQVDHWPS